MNIDFLLSIEDFSIRNLKSLQYKTETMQLYCDCCKSIANCKLNTNISFQPNQIQIGCIDCWAYGSLMNDKIILPWYYPHNQYVITTIPNNCVQITKTNYISKAANTWQLPTDSVAIFFENLSILE